LDFDAIQDGCDQVHVHIPPSGPIGWPSARAVSGAPQATYYGALIASDIGSLSNYAPAIREFNSDTSGPLYAQIAAIVGCAHSTCMSVFQGAKDKGLFAMFAWETCLVTHKPPQVAGLDGISRSSDRDQFVGMFIDELESRCTGNPALHKSAAQLAEVLPTAGSTELLSAKAWVLRRPISDLSRDIPGKDVGVLERVVLMHWDYTDVGSAPALGL